MTENSKKYILSLFENGKRTVKRKFSQPYIISEDLWLNCSEVEMDNIEEFLEYFSEIIKLSETEPQDIPGLIEKWEKLEILK